MCVVKGVDVTRPTHQEIETQSNQTLTHLAPIEEGQPHLNSPAKQMNKQEISV